jgi:hypothetical protein
VDSSPRQFGDLRTVVGAHGIGAEGLEVTDPWTDNGDIDPALSGAPNFPSQRPCERKADGHRCQLERIVEGDGGILTVAEGCNAEDCITSRVRGNVERRRTDYAAVHVMPTDSKNPGMAVDARTASGKGASGASGAPKTTLLPLYISAEHR